MPVKTWSDLALLVKLNKLEDIYSRHIARSNYLNQLGYMCCPWDASCSDCNGKHILPIPLKEIFGKSEQN